MISSSQLKSPQRNHVSYVKSPLWNFFPPQLMPSVPQILIQKSRETSFFPVEQHRPYLYSYSEIPPTKDHCGEI